MLVYWQHGGRINHRLLWHHFTLYIERRCSNLRGSVVLQCLAELTMPATAVIVWGLVCYWRFWRQLYDLYIPLSNSLEYSLESCKSITETNMFIVDPNALCDGQRTVEKHGRQSAHLYSEFLSSGDLNESQLHWQFYVFQTTDLYCFNSLVSYHGNYNFVCVTVCVLFLFMLHSCVLNWWWWWIPATGFPRLLESPGKWVWSRKVLEI